jgi:probable HAF family extracellular repeat protein
MKIQRTIANALSALLLASLPAAAQTYHVVRLATPPGTAFCTPTSINASGDVAGTCATDASQDSTVAVRWHDGVATVLGTLTGGRYSSATAINSSGTIVGDGDTGDFQPTAFVAGGSRLPGARPIGCSSIHAVGITDGGAIFGNVTRGRCGHSNSYPAVWTRDSRQNHRYREVVLPKLAGGDPRSADAVVTASSSRGEVVGWASNSEIGRRAALWSGEPSHAIVALAPLAEGAESIAWGVNDLGQAVGHSGTLDSSAHAVLWQNDAAHTPVDLGTLPGDSGSLAFAANTAGAVIGLSGTGSVTRAFLYQNNAMRELASLIDPADGIWTVDRPYAINNAGQIVGTGSNHGQSFAIVLSPIVQ